MENDSAKAICPVLSQKKIPRPLNAFMLYANEHRKSFTYLFPTDSNKQINRRLRQSWKDLNRPAKKKYFRKAKYIDHGCRRKYPGYVYNPKNARMRKAMRTNLRDRSVGALPMLSMPSGRLYQSLPMGQGDGPMWNGLCDFLANDYQATKFHQEDAGVEPLHFYDSCALPAREEEKMILEKEKATLEAAESYTNVSQYEKLMNSRYLPISTSEIFQDPELFEDGTSFTYVTIPKLCVRQNGQGVSYD